MMKYNDVLDSKRMNKICRNAYTSWKEQRRRCNNIKNKSYKTYGSKGIKVEYTSREFIGWYLEKIKYFKGHFPVVGRIDHSKNYSFNNIAIISRVENAKETILRCGSPLSDRKKPVACYLYKTMELIMVFDSQLDAAKYCKVSRVCLYRVLKNHRKKTGKYFFKYI